MKNYGLKILFVLLIISAMGCGNSQQHSSENSKMDTLSNPALTNQTDLIKQKITPCLWAETTDAKAVADYYLSIFKDGNLKEHHKYKNPPESGGGDFETALIEIAGMELSIFGSWSIFQI